MERPLASSPRRLTASGAIAPLAVYALLVATFFVVRYRGSWVEQDTTQLTAISENVYETGALQPQGKVYPFGFGYAALVTFLCNVSGVPLESLQTLVGPFALVLTALCGLGLFKTLTGDVRLGTVSALILCMQPELLFVAMRGSHEKFTWALVMVTLLLLAQSFSFVGHWAAFVSCIALTYLTVFALISLNSFYASSLTVAVATSFLVGWILVVVRLRQRAQFGRNLGRLLYVVGSCGVLIYLFIFYLYTPSAQVFEMLGTGLDKLAALLLNVETVQAAAPYEYVATAWPSLLVYLALTVVGWLILLASLATWARLAYQMFFRRKTPPLNHLLLWLFFTAFAGQTALALLADQIGLLGTNLQVRLFPGVMLLAIPMVVLELRRLWTKRWRQSRQLRLAVGVVAALSLVWLSATSMLKATLDPVVSNKWLYYTAAEQTALAWTEEKIEHGDIWVGHDERLGLVAYFQVGFDRPSGNDYDILSLGAGTRYVLLSDLVREQAIRIRKTLPDIREAHQLYDSGAVELYEYRPTTPYQR